MYDLNEYRRKSAEKAAIAHSHSYYQIIWFYEEGGEHIIDFKTYTIKKNMILFISKDHIHAFDNNLDVQGCLIHFNESFFMHSDIDIFLKYNIFNSQENPCYSIDQETSKTATAYLDLIRKELSQKGMFGYEDIIRFSLKSLLINLERIHQKDGNVRLQFNNHYELQFAKYKELIEENYQNGLSVSEYAQMLNISSKTLSTITRSVVDKPASLLISERIILEAQRLLRFTTLQIGEIAFRIGFEDSSYFIKYFKRFVGISPKTYRKNSL
ncbi:helix-turn-helix domain-containing protein [Aquimarina sp. RZ0]|nr:helix-turn-helix domain-containing protein [Aquimarina sp. RZ0]